MPNQLTKQYLDFPAGTIVKIKQLEGGLAVITIPSSGDPAKRHMITKQWLGKVPEPVPAPNFSRLDYIPMSYTVAPLNKPIRFSCYCGASKLYFSLEDVQNQTLERLALNKAIAACPHCTDRRSHGSLKPSREVNS